MESGVKPSRPRELEITEQPLRDKNQARDKLSVEYEDLHTEGHKGQTTDGR